MAMPTPRPSTLYCAAATSAPTVVTAWSQDAATARSEDRCRTRERAAIFCTAPGDSSAVNAGTEW